MSFVEGREECVDLASRGSPEERLVDTGQTVLLDSTPDLVRRPARGEALAVRVGDRGDERLPAPFASGALEARQVLEVDVGFADADAAPLERVLVGLELGSDLPADGVEGRSPRALPKAER